MDVLRRHWITGLAVLCLVFLVFLSIAGFAASDPEYEAEDNISAAFAGLGALSLLAGLWGLRGSRFRLWVAHTLIVVGLVMTAMFFWLFLIPTIVGITVLYAGVVKKGLQRELNPV